MPNNRCPHCQGHKEGNWKLLDSIEVDTVITEPGSRDSFFIHFHLNLFCPRWSQIPGLKKTLQASINLLEGPQLMAAGWMY